jgi:hypothetical protein
MKIQVEFSFSGENNFGFKSIYNGVYDKMVESYPDITFNKIHLPELYPICPTPNGRCGTSSMNIINTDNNRTIVLSFWDRSLDIIYDKKSWGELNVVQLIGGLGIHESPEEIKNKTGIIFSPFLYPMEFEHSYNFIEDLRKPYEYNSKIKRACFIGWLYQDREVIANILKKHPLFEIYGHHDGYRGLKYYEKINEHAITLSFNGNGEWCIRDVESIGLGIPIVRSLLKTPFYGGFEPNIDYISGSVESSTATFYYPEYSPKQIAEQFIETVENVINNDELLTSISNRNVEYYKNNLKLNKMIDIFFKIFNIDILK